MQAEHLRLRGSLALQRASFWWKLRSRMLLVCNSRYNIKCLLASLSKREQVWAPEVETMQTRLDVVCGPLGNHQITISYHLHEILMSACWQHFQDWCWRREQPWNRSQSTGDWWCGCYKAGGGGVTTAFSETCLNPDTEETQDSFRGQQNPTYVSAYLVLLPEPNLTFCQTSCDSVATLQRSFHDEIKIRAQTEHPKERAHHPTFLLVKRWKDCRFLLLQCIFYFLLSRQSSFLSHVFM